MSDRLQEIKYDVKAWRSWAANTHGFEIDLEQIANVEWLISEVERLQAKNEKIEEHKRRWMNTSAIHENKSHESQQKIERLEKALEFYAHENGNHPLVHKTKLMNDSGKVAKQALETEGKE